MRLLLCLAALIINVFLIIITGRSCSGGMFIAGGGHRCVMTINDITSTSRSNTRRIVVAVSLGWDAVETVLTESMRLCMPFWYSLSEIVFSRSGPPSSSSAFDVMTVLIPQAGGCEEVRRPL